MQLVVDNLAKSFGVKTIFKNVSFMIDKGEKSGLSVLTAAANQHFCTACCKMDTATAAACALKQARASVTWSRVSAISAAAACGSL